MNAILVTHTGPHKREGGTRTVIGDVGKSDASSAVSGVSGDW